MPQIQGAQLGHGRRQVKACGALDVSYMCAGMARFNRGFPIVYAPNSTRAG